MMLNVHDLVKGELNADTGVKGSTWDVYRCAPAAGSNVKERGRSIGASGPCTHHCLGDLCTQHKPLYSMELMSCLVFLLI